MKYNATLLKGDGIGPEVTEAACRIIEASGVQIEWENMDAGQNALEKWGTTLPDATLESVKKNKIALKGPIGTPIGKGFRSVNVQLRKELDLYANFRPAKKLPGTRSLYNDVDLIVIRENTEGLYSGLEHEIVPGIIESLRIITRNGSERILHFAFEKAREFGRKKVTAVHKANILKLSDGLFLEVAREIANQYPDIDYEESIVDATAMKLAMNPANYDVMVMENLFGDIISDLTSGFIGGLGMAPSANIGKNAAVFEAVHGSAPDIAGQGIANPTAVTLSACLMLHHIGESKAADQITHAINEVLSQGHVLPRDMKGQASTAEYTDAIIRVIEKI